MAKLEDVIKAAGGGKLSGRFSVPLSLIKIDPALDKRDRSSDRYLQHFNNVKAGIVARKGIEDTVEVHRGIGDTAVNSVWVINGRTRVLAAREAIAEGLLGDATEDTFLVPVEVKSGNELDFLATQLRTQQVLTLTSVEQAAIVAEMVRMAGGLEAPVAAALGKSLKQVQDLLQVDQLMPQVKALVSNGLVAPTVALELAQEHSGQEVVAILQAAQEAKNTSAPESSGKGKPKNRLTKREIFNAKFNAQSEAKQKMLRNQMTHDLLEILKEGQLDPYTITQLHELALKEFN